MEEDALCAVVCFQRLHLVGDEVVRLGPRDALELGIRTAAVGIGVVGRPVGALHRVLRHVGSYTRWVCESPSTQARLYCSHPAGMARPFAPVRHGRTRWDTSRDCSANRRSG